MTYVSGSYKNGALYQVSTTLPVGNHKFTFVFYDSSTSWADPMGEMMFAGPNVGPNAQAVQAGTIITLDPHDAPIIPDPASPVGSSPIAPTIDSQDTDG